MDLVPRSREYGASRATLDVAESLGRFRLVDSRGQNWVPHVLAMDVGRVVYRVSKLALANLWHDIALRSMCGLGVDRP